jgi:thiamine kinase-like enzyme
MVLNHKKGYRMNFLINESKDIKILDQEYAFLNLIKIDIVNYMFETNLQCEALAYPFYEFLSDQIDFENYLEIFLNKFEVFTEKK